MATIENVRLEIIDIPSSPGRPTVRVSYRVRATQDDGVAERSYREVVELVGIDEGPGEDGQNELIPGGRILDGVVTFSTSQVAFDHSPEASLSLAVLAEDGLFRQAEIRARVSLIPLPPKTVTRDSNLVRRGLANQQSLASA